MRTFNESVAVPKDCRHEHLARLREHMIGPTWKRGAVLLSRFVEAKVSEPISSLSPPRGIDFVAGRGDGELRVVLLILAGAIFCYYVASLFHNHLIRLSAYSI